MPSTYRIVTKTDGLTEFTVLEEAYERGATPTEKLSASGSGFVVDKLIERAQATSTRNNQRWGVRTTATIGEVCRRIEKAIGGGEASLLAGHGIGWRKSSTSRWRLILPDSAGWNHPNARKLGL